MVMLVMGNIAGIASVIFMTPCDYAALDYAETTTDVEQIQNGQFP